MITLVALVTLFVVLLPFYFFGRRKPHRYGSFWLEENTLPEPISIDNLPLTVIEQKPAFDEAPVVA
jgi:hypothetical protein